MTERYQGVKFKFHRHSRTYPYDQRLAELNNWAYLFAQLGLTPIHPDGAYGNQSYKVDTDSFMITRSGMLPEKRLQVDNYTLVEGFDDAHRTFQTRGISPPSSECFLHLHLYRANPAIHAILHGHSELLLEHADELQIPCTAEFHDYGTEALAISAQTTMEQADNFFLLKDHGFVALGSTIESAGKRTLDYVTRLLQLLQHR